MMLTAAAEDRGDFPPPITYYVLEVISSLFTLHSHASLW